MISPDLASMAMTDRRVPAVVYRPTNHQRRAFEFEFGPRDRMLSVGDATPLRACWFEGVDLRQRQILAAARTSAV